MEDSAGNGWREKFLAGMEGAVAWGELEAMIEKSLPDFSNGRVNGFPLATMLRIYCMQQWFAYSNRDMARSLLRHESVRRFAGLGMRRSDATPDEHAIGEFAQRLLARGIGPALADPLRGPHSG